MRTARQLSVFLLCIAGIIALYGGIHMIFDPTGNSLGFPFYLLNGSVFTDYLLLGWVLLGTIGVFSTLIIMAILAKNRYYSFFIMVQGVIICVFSVVIMVLLSEIFIIEYFFLILGMGLIGLGVLQFQRKIALDAESKPEQVQKSHHHKQRRHK